MSAILLTLAPAAALGWLGWGAYEASTSEEPQRPPPPWWVLLIVVTLCVVLLLAALGYAARLAGISGVARKALDTVPRGIEATGAALQGAGQAVGAAVGLT